MAKKFGKTLLFTTAAVSAAAAFYFYLQKKNAAQKDSEEEDYDDFSEEPDEDTESSRSYVPLNHEAATMNQDENAQDNQEKESETNVDEASSSTSVEEFPIENSSDTSNSSAEKAPENTFTPLTEQVAQAADNAPAAVEDFLDEEDGPGVEPPITEN